MDATALARACAETMYAQDATSQGLGIELISAEPGRATLAMTVTEAMTNWLAICHGGYTFLLADAAFGYACHTRNQHMVAQHNEIVYLAPAKRGDRLIAQAVERHRAARSGLYDVTVTRDDGMVIAEMRAQARAVEGAVVKAEG